MAIKQISIFLENKQGTLVQITQVFADLKINLKAMSLADSTDFGIARIIVDNPDEIVTEIQQKDYIAKIKAAATDPSTQIKEIIIATNPTVEGDTTALYLNKVIGELGLASAPKVTRLATGIPVGGDLEYIDKRTLSLSFRGRSTI